MFSWIKRGKPQERRREARVDGPSLAAFYWTGGISNPCRVCNISRKGAYIETDQNWYVGTILHLVLESNALSQPSPETNPTFGLWARIVHTEPLTDPHNRVPQNELGIRERELAGQNAGRVHQGDSTTPSELRPNESGPYSPSPSRGMGMEFVLTDRRQATELKQFLDAIVARN